MLIGVTGGIGAGKSSVAPLLATHLEATLLSADEICRRALKRDQPGYQQLVDLWGETYLDRAGDIDRVLLRTAVFMSKELRGQLEAVLHPIVREQLLEAKKSADRTAFVVAEVPLLFESGWQDDFDGVVCVYSPAEQAAVRVARRDQTDVTEVRQIIAVQLDPEVKKDRADFVIDNSAGWIETEKQVSSLAELLRGRFSCARDTN